RVHSWHVSSVQTRRTRAVALSTETSSRLAPVGLEAFAQTGRGGFSAFVDRHSDAPAAFWRRRGLCSRAMHCRTASSAFASTSCSLLLLRGCGIVTKG